MSDAMSNREIEDVLSSIRRLVAQEVTQVVRVAEPDRLILTEAQRVAAESTSAPVAPGASETLPAPDFGRLEATIAELEAAVAASSDGAPEAPRGSNVTELYGRITFAHRDPAPDRAEGTAPDEAAIDDPMVQDAVVEALIEADDAVTEAEAHPVVEPVGEPLAEPVADDEAVLDEAALRAIIAQVVREELHGQLGERITAQVRKLVRIEIAKALDERNYL